MMTAHRWIALMLGVLASPVAAVAQDKPARALFADDRPLHLVIRGPIDAAANRTVDATLSVVGDGKPDTVAVTLAARGITRRRHDVCPFPPLSVIFPDKPAADSLFAKQKSLKLVTHCRPAAAFQQYQLLELAAYRMYGLLTPLSFRTRLATIDYIGTSGKPIATRTGFFIESIDDVARRNGTSVYKSMTRVPPAQISARDAARYALFQVMIGNVDWAMNAASPGSKCCHNSRLLGAPTVAPGLLPIPYDYDSAGLVDPPYAAPPANIDITDVRVRRYRGFCRNNAELPAAAAALSAHRAAITAVLDAMPGLEAKPREKAKAYLGPFFNQIATPQGLQQLTATCVGPY